MSFIQAWLLRSLWIAFGAIWLVGALRAERTVRRPPRLSYWPHLALMNGGLLLMLNVFGAVWPLELRLWPSRYAFAPGFLLTACGLGIAIWARVHLGRYWSATVGSKANHRLVESGPYAQLRHPIYTGIALGVLGTGIADGTLHTVSGALLLVLGMVAKARREEAWLGQEFGASYDAYRRRSWALLPFVY